ncbi:hypothetical protein OESDEN_11734 [Oesophagostomum dentatum]|uniref:Uncharacterized protein n=1 Tax=Oesophagostomum dentatum TaxID=61180 RepID=A0A0B1SX26_OESDE|nr:hypothetical protein OESDEN_11734 [Oesophagostomum dentatum]
MVCTPAPQTSRHQPQASATGMGSKVKRANNQTEITAVSNQIFDPFKNENHLHVFQALLDDYVQSKGLTYDKSLVKTTIKNEGGMFAVLYTIVGYDCDQVSTIIKKQKIQRDVLNGYQKNLMFLNSW